MLPRCKIEAEETEQRTIGVPWSCSRCPYARKGLESTSLQVSTVECDVQRNREAGGSAQVPRYYWPPLNFPHCSFIGVPCRQLRRDLASWFYSKTASPFLHMQGRKRSTRSYYGSRDGETVNNVNNHVVHSDLDGILRAGTRLLAYVV